MNNTHWLFATLVLSIAPISFTQADDRQVDDHRADAYPVVAGFERFAEVEEVTNVERGMLLLNELNCMSCHQTESSWALAPKQAPILTEVGSRVLPEYFEKFITDPHGTKPGTTMPDVLAHKLPAEKQQIANSIGHFLASTGQSVKQNSSSALVNQGKQLFHSIGCVACHDPQIEEVQIATSIPLGKLEEKYTLPGLTKFVQDPLHVRPSGRMPQLNLASKEAQAIASYLLRDTVVDARINFAYYEGSWEKLPKFDQLKPALTGIASGFEMLVGPKKDHFGVVYTGYWITTKDAKYWFRLGSDDGSQLIIDGKVVLQNDGIHGMIFKETELEIPAGDHEVRVEFFEAAGGEELKVEVFGGGLEGVGLESLLRATKEEAARAENEAFQIDAVKVARGKDYFQSLGCATCHELKMDGKALASTSILESASLKDLNLKHGCFDGSGSAANFELSLFQVKCLTAAIEHLKDPPPGAVDLEQVVHEKLVTLNCYACHNRERPGGLIFGGVVDQSGDSSEIYGRRKWFTGTQVEMGDEGQHPPALKSAGAKLNPNWLDKVLNEGVKSRPYMNSRMPKFGGKQVFGELAQQLIVVDKLTDIPVITQTEPLRKIKAHGRFLAGEEALSCIKCHTFGKYNATGVQSIDLTTMTQRLDKYWFQAYMLKPSKFRRGTRMPESWPGGRSFYPDMLEGNAQKQIDAIWAFLSDGDKAAKPKGLVRSKNELKAINRPIIYRNFIEGAGPRAIGVGYPEQTNLAFDAQDCRMALLWQENFIDASRHWNGRGQGFEGPLGENILKLPDSIVFASKLNDGKWPKEFTEAQRPRFMGYRFDKDRRPIFKYQVGDVTIEDQPIPYIKDGRPLLKRILKFTSAGSKTISYLAAVGDKVEFKSDSVLIGDNFKTTISGAEVSSSKTADGQAAVIAVIDLSTGTAEIEQVYDW